MGVNSLPNTVTRQRHGCDLNLRLSPARWPLGYRAIPSRRETIIRTADAVRRCRRYACATVFSRLAWRCEFGIKLGSHVASGAAQTLYVRRHAVYSPLRHLRRNTPQYATTRTKVVIIHLPNNTTVCTRKAEKRIQFSSVCMHLILDRNWWVFFKYIKERIGLSYNSVHLILAWVKYVA